VLRLPEAPGRPPRVLREAISEALTRANNLVNAGMIGEAVEALKQVMSRSDQLLSKVRAVEGTTCSQPWLP